MALSARSRPASVPVCRVRLRDRGVAEAGEERITVTCALLPRWARRTRSRHALIPILHLRGISTGDVQEALAALLSADAPNPSPAAITRLTETWQAE